MESALRDGLSYQGTLHESRLAGQFLDRRERYADGDSLAGPSDRHFPAAFGPQISQAQSLVIQTPRECFRPLLCHPYPEYEGIEAAS